MLTILTPKQAVARIKELLVEAPIDSFMTCPPAGYPLSRFIEHAELFAKEVIPAFQ
jgi:hypothetical protein